MIVQASSPTIYDQDYAVGSTITTGTAITLPASGSYTGDELEVRLNGVRMDYGVDFTTVGSPPRTQIAFTFNLVNGDVLNFRVDRSP